MGSCPAATSSTCMTRIRRPHEVLERIGALCVVEGEIRGRSERNADENGKSIAPSTDLIPELVERITGKVVSNS